MTYAILDENRVIVNIIEVEPENAAAFGAHYLGDNPLGIGDQYPAEDLTPPVPPTDTQLLERRITDLHLSTIAQGQKQTALELALIEQGQYATNKELEAMQSV